MFLLTALLATSQPALAAPTTYKLDPSKGNLYVLVYKDPNTSLAGMSHDHAVRATGWSGSVTWDPDNPGACAIDITVPVRKLAVDEDHMRKLAGIEGSLDAGQREDIKENMLDDDQLDAGAFPNITFKASSCTGTAPSVTVKGDFNLHGKSQAKSVPMKVTVDGSSLKAKGSFETSCTAHGFEPFSALIGQLKNQDKMKVVIDVQGRP
ncbi:MAG: YceI family protein [Myxococcota bacterium]|jgi:polyisoprenoid-binding protein YceI|nr:YceI family protein [Myxococcota bacterium]